MAKQDSLCNTAIICQLLVHLDTSKNTPSGRELILI